MVVYVQSRKITLAALASEIEIWKETVQDGFKITILEIGFLMPTDARIDGYVDEVKIDQVYGQAYPDMSDRAVVNRELNAGQFWEFKGSSTAGGAAAVLLVYDKVRT